MGAWYVFAAYSTPAGVRISADGPFSKGSSADQPSAEAEEFAMRLKNTMGHPDVLWHQSEQLSEAKKGLRHLIHAETGDIKDIPQRQYSMAPKLTPPEFQEQEGAT